MLTIFLLNQHNKGSKNSTNYHPIFGLLGLARILSINPTYLQSVSFFRAAHYSKGIFQVSSFEALISGLVGGSTHPFGKNAQVKLDHLPG